MKVLIYQFLAYLLIPVLQCMPPPAPKVVVVKIETPLSDLDLKELDAAATIPKEGEVIDTGRQVDLDGLVDTDNEDSAEASTSRPLNVTSDNLQKILNGVFTGNLNSILRGSTRFISNPGTRNNIETLLTRGVGRPLTTAWYTLLGGSALSYALGGLPGGSTSSLTPQQLQALQNLSVTADLTADNQQQVQYQQGQQQIQPQQGQVQSQVQGQPQQTAQVNWQAPVAPAAAAPQPQVQQPQVQAQPQQPVLNNFISSPSLLSHQELNQVWNPTLAPPQVAPAPQQAAPVPQQAPAPAAQSFENILSTLQQPQGTPQGSPNSPPVFVIVIQVNQDDVKKEIPAEILAAAAEAVTISPTASPFRPPGPRTKPTSPPTTEALPEPPTEAPTEPSIFAELERVIGITGKPKRRTTVEPSTRPPLRQNDPAAQQAPVDHHDDSQEFKQEIDFALKRKPKFNF